MIDKEYATRRIVGGGALIAVGLLIGWLTAMDADQSAGILVAAAICVVASVVVSWRMRAFVESAEEAARVKASMKGRRANLITVALLVGFSPLLWLPDSYVFVAGAAATAGALVLGVRILVRGVQTKRTSRQ
jgi:hypothetical protein